MIAKPSELYQIQEPEASAKRETLHLTGDRPRGIAVARRIGRPWPRQLASRGYLRRAKKTRV
jgi:hypothetical protein